TERSSITLTCPHDDGGSHVPTWSREIGGKQQPIRLHDSTVTKTLMFPNLQPADSGLYLCDGKLAVYLNVIKEENRKPPTTPTTTLTTTTIKTTVRTPTRRQTAAATTTSTTTKKRRHTKKPGKKGKTTSAPPADTDMTPTTSAPLWLMPVRVVIVTLYLIIMISITMTTWRRARQIQKRHTAETENHL
ncbi:uncharacterized protein LOC121913206 isoform X1, partial [Scomber scombrus]